jgi:hypothetical protein
MKYKEMLEDARQHGINSEKAMYKSIEDIDDLLCIVKEHDKQAYWDFIMTTYGTLYSNHFETEDFARWFVDRMESTQSDGSKLRGQYWDCEQVYEAYRGMGISIPSEVTKLDLYVAANAAKHDFGSKFSDEQVLEIAYLFYFADEDFPTNDKIFRYMELTRETE